MGVRKQLRYLPLTPGPEKNRQIYNMYGWSSAAPQVVAPQMAVPTVAAPQMAVYPTAVPQMAVPQMTVPAMAVPQIAAPQGHTVGISTRHHTFSHTSKLPQPLAAAPMVVQQMAVPQVAAPYMAAAPMAAPLMAAPQMMAPPGRSVGITTRHHSFTRTK